MAIEEMAELIQAINKANIGSPAPIENWKKKQISMIGEESFYNEYELAILNKVRKS